MTTPLVRIANVTKTFPEATSPSIDGISIDIFSGEIFGIIGQSGAGKSTLVRMINGLTEPDSGSVTVAGHSISTIPKKLKRELRHNIGMVFQHFNLFSTRTVGGNVEYPLTLAKWKKPERRARVEELLEFVGILHLRNKYPEQLSGGQKQRVGIARALAARPQVLLADEATSALDPQTTVEVLNLLKTINKELGLTIIVITHSLEVVRYLCDRVAVLDHGKVVELATTYDLFSNPQSEVARSFIPQPIALTQQELVIDVRQYPDWGIAAQTISEEGLRYRIVRANVHELAGKSYGSITVELNGPDTAQEKFRSSFPPRI